MPPPYGVRIDHVARELAARAVAHLRELAHDLVERRIDEVEELDLGDRLEPVKGHADRGADDPGLGERRVDHAVGAELLQEPVRRAEDPTVHADVLSEEQDVRVGPHGVAERPIDGLDERELGHPLLPALARVAAATARSSSSRGVIVRNTSSRNESGSTGASPPRR